MDGREGRLPFDPSADEISRRDESARRAATDPLRNVVLEASAGTGKTTVLVTRYLNLLKAGVDPTNILAITFTRKAAAEMRQRIVHELQKAAVLSPADAARWHDLRDRLGDIAISTIDAFCLALLREFPLEAGLDPGFDVADETLATQLEEESLDRTLAICRRLAVNDESVRVLVAHLGESRLRRALARLLGRRLVARAILRRFTRGSHRSIGDLCDGAAGRFDAVLAALPDGLDRFIADGPAGDAAFQLVASDLRRLRGAATAQDAAALRAALDGVRGWFLTLRGEPRKRLAGPCDRTDFPSPDAYRRHLRGVVEAAPRVRELLDGFRADLNAVLARGVRRAFEVAAHQFRRSLEANAVLDFSELLARTLELLGRMDEFSQSRYRLEARYHHVLVDEFQDTSRAQWHLVSLLVKSWGEGAGLAGGVVPPSIFVVGDRKQSIYGFRDADATILGRARRDIEALRPAGRVRRSISRSFRSAPALLSFANDLFACVEPGVQAGRFRFGPRDRFPVDEVPDGEARIGLVTAEGMEACAAGVAAEIERVLAAHTIVRDPRAGTAREARPGDIAVLFRSREGHQEYERALAARGVPSYVYKGLGFFDADETRDVLALVDYLAHPDSDLAAAVFLRSRVVRLSDPGLRRLAPAIAGALTRPTFDQVAALDAEDRAILGRARAAVAAWLPLVDRLTPSEVVDRALTDSAYAFELRGRRRIQARENVKKMRALVRKIQNRGYATLADVAGHLRTLSAGDESNAVVDAVDAVNLMTVHAAKGLEFPIVFLVNLSRGTAGGRDPIRVLRDGGTPSVSVGDFASEADDRAPERDVEETKRLLYVAVTRARDRLYFSSPTREGRVDPRRGSIASVLPASFISLFNEKSEESTITWRGPGGRAHAIRVCGHVPGAGVAVREDGPGGTGQGPAWVDAFGPLPCDGVPRVAVTAMTADAEAAPKPFVAGRTEDERVGQHERLVGLLVHRLFQFGNAEAAMSEEDLARRARALLEADELYEAGDGEAAVVGQAIAALAAVRANARIGPLLGQGRWYHEVPFSLVDEGAVLRGVIDSVVEHADQVTVVEIKTGKARPEHERQLDLYRKAAELLFPGRRIDAVLVYATPAIPS